MEFEEGKTEGVRFLIRNQLPSGEFPTVISKNRLFTSTQPMPNVFTTAVILHALRSVKDEPEVMDAAQRAIQWLKGQLDPAGFWVFFGRSMRNWLPEEQLPPDTDTNTCIASAFMDWNVDFPHQEFVRKLIKHQGTNSPLGTWIYGTDLDWHPSVELFVNRYDVDPVVNANAAYLFYQHGMILPEIERYLEHQVISGQFHRPSSFYFSTSIFIYSLSKLFSFRPQFMDGEIGKACRKALMFYITETDHSKITPLEKAAAISAVLRAPIHSSDIQVDDALSWLQGLQAKDGGWNPHPLHSTYGAHYGSRELTTALVVEAMALRDFSVLS